MNAAELFKLAPLGAVVAFSDGTPKPPAHHKKKLREWLSANSTGIFVRAHKKESGKDYARDYFVLQTLNDDSGYIGLVVNTMFSVENSMGQSFAVTPPTPGTILAYCKYSAADEPEIKYVWKTVTDALAWCAKNRYDLRHYGNKHFIVTTDGTLADWNAEEAYP